MRLVLLLVVCMSSCKKDRYGERLPEHDDLCPKGQQSYYRPKDGGPPECGLVWAMTKGGSEQSAYCCPKD